MHLICCRWSPAVNWPWDGHRSNGRWTYGKITETSPDSDDRPNWTRFMSRAGLVLDHAPDLLPLVACGELALDAAVRQASESRDVKKRRAELPDDLGALVDAAQVTLVDALRRARGCPVGCVLSKR